MSETSKYDKLIPLHSVLIMMLKDFIKICEDYDLKWYAHYGTAIGALREKGFIPWDEDVDILMPRNDLTQFTEIVINDYSDKYEMINSEINVNYPMATTRMMLKGTKLEDSSLATMEFPSMIFLDLFPLDSIADNKKDRKEQIRKAWLFNKLQIIKLVRHPFIAGSGFKSKFLKFGVKLLRTGFKVPFIQKMNFNKKALDWQTKYDDLEDTKYIGFLCDTAPTMDLYLRSDFEPARWMDFEEIQLRFPNKIEKHLTELYGDYMTPIDASRRDDHFPDILDLGPYSKEFGSLE